MTNEIYIVIPSCEQEQIKAYSEEKEALKYLISILERYSDISGKINKIEIIK